MNAVLAFLKRRWWLTQERLFSTLILVFITPVILYLLIHLPLSAIVVRSVRNIPYGDWALPGYLMIVSFFGLIPTIYRDLFELRLHGKALLPITLTPVSKFEIVVGILITAIVEAMIFQIFGLIVFLMLMDLSYRWFDFITIFLYLILQMALIGNVLIMTALLVKRVTTFLPVVLIILAVYMFGSGMIFEFEFYPLQVGEILKYLPTSLLLDNLRTILFTRYFIWWSFLIPIGIIIGLVIINSKLLRHVLKQ